METNEAIALAILALKEQERAFLACEAKRHEGFDKDSADKCNEAVLILSAIKYTN